MSSNIVKLALGRTFLASVRLEQTKAFWARGEAGMEVRRVEEPKWDF
jgi:hypothetical protein